jgi:hypothetical protein
VIVHHLKDMGFLAISESEGRGLSKREIPPITDIHVI